MIKINLLEETRTAAKGRGGGVSLPKIEVAENIPVLILLVGVGLALFGVGAGWFWYRTRIEQLDTQIATAEAKLKSLEYVRAEADKLNSKKAELNHKIDIISQLKAKQAVPVTLLDQLSKTLPDHVWFDELNFSGETVTIRGKAQTPIAYSSFLRNLEENTKYFTNVATGKIVNDRGLTNFQLTAVFRPPAPPGAPAEGSGTQAATGSADSGASSKKGSKKK